MSIGLEEADEAPGLAGDDKVRPFSVAALDTRGRAIQMGPVLDAILERHAYPPPVSRLLAEAIVLGVLLAVGADATHAAQPRHVRVSGREYVRLGDWARANQFTPKWLVRNKTLQYSNRTTTLVFTLAGGDRRDARINGVRVLLAFPPSTAAGTVPGLMKSPIIGGISPLWIRLSRTTGARIWPFGFTTPPPSWKTITGYSRAASRFAGR